MKIIYKKYIFTIFTLMVILSLVVVLKIKQVNNNKTPKRATLVEFNILGSETSG